MFERSRPIRSLHDVPSRIAPFSSQQEYRSFCDSVASIEHALSEAPLFQKLLGDINSRANDPMIIQTPWGGVFVESLENNNTIVEKNLVVKGGKYLAYEKHEEKIEELTWKEGLGVLIYRPEDETELRTAIIQQGFAIKLRPGQEHAIIAISDLVVWEESLDPKGMDQDLIFLYQPA
ncbi:hypothetical protein EBR25_12095 [bacterium]|nr:hypothetical protein [bacterium]